MTSEAAARRLDYRRSNRHSIITVSSDGKLGVDDNIMALDKALFSSDINVRNTTLAQFMASPFWQELVRGVDSVPAKCGSCEWYRTCRSGDLFNRYKKGAGFDQPSVFCDTLDTVHTAMAAIVARQENGLERLTQVLGRKPELWARDLTHPVVLGAAPTQTQMPETDSMRLPVIE
jgi:uncharacterized protein